MSKYFSLIMQGSMPQRRTSGRIAHGRLAARRALPLIVLLFPILFPWQVALAQYTISTVAGGSPQSTPVPASQASIGAPRAVATDAAGNLYFTSQNCVYMMDRGGTLHLIAGNSQPGYSGDGGPAVQAELHSPAGVAVDSAGNVYIADTLNHSIREVTTDGKISTIAGVGFPGFAGDGGAASNALFDYPTGIAVDSSGNVYIADTYNNRVREISGGNISSIAGIGIAGFSGDGAGASTAQLTRPNGVAVDADGNIYIADTGNNRVRRIDSSGNIVTVGGTGTGGFSGDGGKATSAQMTPYAVAVDPSGNIFFADLYNSRIREIAKGTLTITTVAGNGTFGNTGDGSSATDAAVKAFAIAADGFNNIYMADPYDNSIRKISIKGSITTVAGNGSLQYSGDGGPAASAQLLFPYGVAVDAAGNYYIADTDNNVVRRIARDGTIATVAGNGTFGYSGDGGPAVNAQLGQPAAVAVNDAGNIYIADTANAVIREVTPDGNISTIAGTGVPGYSGDGGPARSAQLTQPNGLALDAAGNLYVADSNSNAIRRISPDGIITTVAGDGLPRFSGDGGPASNAELNHPMGVAADHSGNIFIADTYNNRVRKISGGVITTVSGSGDFGLLGDGGPATAAEMYFPTAVAVDAAGNLYIADSGNSIIRCVNNEQTITTIAGTGAAGLSGDGGPATKAQLSQPTGIAVDGEGNLLVADASNSTIRLLQPTASDYTPALYEASPGVVAAQDLSFNAIDPTNPAKPGQPIILYASGLGPVTNQPASGAVALASPLSETVTSPIVTIGNQPAVAAFSGLTPGYSSLYQINITVPASLAPGNYPIAVTIGGKTSNASSISVQ